MSVGRPGSGWNSLTAAPPDRGSFPLDHDGECKEFMTSYLKCLRSNGNVNGACRHLSKQYLACRMDNGLMERVGWDDLGLQDDKKATNSTSDAGQSQKQ